MGKLFYQACSVEFLEMGLKRGARKNTIPGPDGITWNEIKNNHNSVVKSLHSEILTDKYHASQPKIISRSYSRDPRNILKCEVSNVRDRVVEQSIKIILSSLFEKIFSPNSCAYRAGKGEKYFSNLSGHRIKAGFKYVMILDVESFFSSVDLNVLCSDLLLITEDEELVSLISECMHFPGRSSGLPLGHVLSPCLSNLYLHPVDMTLTDINWLRYGDSWFLFFETPADWISLERRIQSAVSKRSLSLNKGKSKVMFDPTPAMLLRF